MPDSGLVLTGPYDQRLVIISVACAILAAYTAFALATRVSFARPQTRPIWLISCAVAIGAGIWSMHFIGMLGLRLSLAVRYDLPTVLASLIVAVVPAGLALALVNHPRLAPARLLLGGLVLGLGILLTHERGMAAMRLAATVSYRPSLVALALGVAVGLSTAALWLTFGWRGGSFRRQLARRLGGALLLGGAIVATHAIMVVALVLTSTAVTPPASEPALDQFTLGLAVALATLIVLGFALLSVVVDQRFARRTAQLRDSEQRYRSLVERHPDAIYQLDLDGTIVAANPAAISLTGYPLVEMQGRPFTALAIVEDAPRVTQYLAAAARGEAEHSTITIVQQAGRHVTLRMTSVPILVDKHVVGVYALAHDVTAQQQAEAALQQERDLLHTLMDNIPDTIYFKDAASRFTRINRAQAHVLGLSAPAEAIGKTDFDFFTVEHASDAYADEQAILRSGRPLIGKLEQSRRPDGTFWWHSATKVPIRDAAGQIIGTVGISRDVTALHSAEAALRESEARLRAVVTNVPVVLFAVDSAGVFTLSEGKGLEKLGLRPGQVVGYSVFTIYHDQPALLDDIRAALAGATMSVTREVAGLIFETWYAPLLDQDGQQRGTIGVAIDITERQATEQALERLQHQHGLILQSAGEGICGVDTDGQMMFANQAAATMLGWSSAELLGQPIQAVLRASLPGGDPVDLAFAPSTESGTPQAVDDALFWRKDGTSFPVEYVCTPIREQNRVVGTVIVFKDISERKRAEEVLRQSIETREALRLRDQFMSIASHELKTPLTALLGNTELLQRRVRRADLLPAREAQTLEVIVQQALRMSRMIETLLDLSRIQGGRLSVERTPLDLCALVQRIVAELRLTLTDHTIRLAGDDVPLIVAGDELRLEQVLQNLLGNAIKYSPQGGEIVVTLARCDTSRCAVIAVRDDGLGIPSSALPHLFERFFRAGNAAGRQIGGLGIGLFVVKEIITLHGGNVAVESREGEGSTFSVTLPLLIG